MTSTTSPPHRYRCETCAHHIFHKGMKHPHFCDHPVAQNDGYLSLKFITLEEYERIQFMGCCSHSQHQDAEQRIADVIPKLESICDKISKIGQANVAAELVEAIALLREGK